MRPVTIATLAAVPLLLLGACDQFMPAPAPAPEPTPPPPATSAVLGGLDLSQPFTVRGNEPFWAIAVTPATLDYSGVDRPQETAAKPGPQVTSTVATLTVTTSLNNPLVIVLTVGPCSDGMSETVYPLNATVIRPGETLTGCAGA
ncbi:MAG: hypothetical protein K2Y04_07900 [Caulobacteraceae bacterium]|nr:hypothetical protein [Caulobacteraceae bacterium]